MSVLLRAGLGFCLLLACSEQGSAPAQAGGAGLSSSGGTESSAGGGSSGQGGGSSGTASGGTGGGTTGEAGAGAAPAGATCDDFGAAPVVRTYTPKQFALGDDPSADPECTAIVNPERGFRSTSNLRSGPDFSGARDEGQSTVYGAVLLDDYLEQDLDQGLLETLSDAFAAARTAGVKLLPRFYYQADLEAGSTDATLERALGHIEQLAPLLQDNADVIAAMHAGFVGAWGEWHGSTTGLHEEGPRGQILAALLGALPPSRMLLVRRPSFKSLAYAGGPLTEESSFDESELARLGHLNRFLASDDDLGTYQEDGEKDYAAADSAFTAVDGETCAENPPRSECEAAKAELALHHWSTLNIDYQAGVLDGWRSAGCFDEIACRLGYRLVLLGHSSPASARRGELLPFSLSLVNDGYARPYNARPIWLVLKGPEERALPLAGADPRRFAPGETIDVCLGAELPDDLLPGDYELGIALPDPAPTLAGDERYAVRFVNDITWMGGVNWLGVHVAVTD